MQEFEPCFADFFVSTYSPHAYWSNVVLGLGNYYVDTTIYKLQYTETPCQIPFQSHHGFRTEIVEDRIRHIGGELILRGEVADAHVTLCATVGRGRVREPDKIICIFLEGLGVGLILRMLCQMAFRKRTA